MPMCDVCGCKDFEIVDGEYFCSDCNSQSFDIRDVIVGEDPITPSQGAFGQMQSTLELRQKRPKSPKSKLKDVGRPWFTTEAFQFIMKLQVDFLISIGCTPRLRDSVGQLWFRYLKKGGVAFCGENPTSVLRTRDLNQMKLMNPPKETDDEDDDSCPSVRKSRKSSSNSADEEEGSRTPPSGPSDDDVSDDSAFSCDPDADAFSSDPEADLTGRKRHRINHMIMPLTICFCYLGLSLVKELHVTVSDLIRWIAAGHFPYLGISASIPEDMKFTSREHNIFCTTTVLSAHRLRRYASRLAFYLGLKQMDLTDINDLVGRFIVDLGLTCDLHGVVSNLIRLKPRSIKTKCVKSSSHIRNSEGIAMAYLIVALKLLFGSSEQQLKRISNFTQNIQTLIDKDIELFDFLNWLKSFKRCYDLYKSITPAFTKKEILKQASLSSYLNYHRDVLSKSRDKCVHGDEFLMSERRSAIEEPFRQLLQQNEPSESEINIPYPVSATSMPLKITLNDQHLYDFTKTSLIHLTDRDTLVDKIRNSQDSALRLEDLCKLLADNNILQSRHTYNTYDLKSRDFDSISNTDVDASYLLLLEIFSDYVAMLPQDLHKLVYGIEVVLVIPQKELTFNETTRRASNLKLW